MKLAKIHHRVEPIWHVQLAILVAIFAQVFLDKAFVVGWHYGLAVVEGLLLIAISLPGSKKSHGFSVAVRRLFAIALLLLITVTNIVSLLLVSHMLLNGSVTDGHTLIYSALVIYATNIVVFGLLYWELDDYAGNSKSTHVKEFLFPQMTPSTEQANHAGWQPTFFDYLYVSITNATAFSPTDAMPLTHRTKLLMSVQAFTSLATIALVAARAISILG